MKINKKRYFKSHSKSYPEREIFFIVNEHNYTENMFETLNGKRVELVSWKNNMLFTKNSAWIDEEMTKEEFFIYCI